MIRYYIPAGLSLLEAVRQSRVTTRPCKGFRRLNPDEEDLLFRYRHRILRDGLEQALRWFEKELGISPSRLLP